MKDGKKVHSFLALGNKGNITDVKRDLQSNPGYHYFKPQSEVFKLVYSLVDLKRFVSQLRTIPNNTGEFRICNSKGGGILDCRIPASQHEDLRFKTEADFNKYFTDPLRKDIAPTVAKSHSIPHEIYFTHGDLNMRNILAQDGKTTGIVDWENAGWLPEYWEYAKIHYTVRGSIRWLADVVDRVFEGYREELWVENLLSDLLGPF